MNAAPALRGKLSEYVFIMTQHTPISNPLPRGFTNALPQVAVLALSRNDAAKALSISLPTLDRLVSRGLLRPSRGCRKPTFSVRELERYLEITARFTPALKELA
jgi:hypothetical protein